MLGSRDVERRSRRVGPAPSAAAYGGRQYPDSPRGPQGTAPRRAIQETQPDQRRNAEHVGGPARSSGSPARSSGSPARSSSDTGRSSGAAGTWQCQSEDDADGPDPGRPPPVPGGDANDLSARLLPDATQQGGTRCQVQRPAFSTRTRPEFRNVLFGVVQSSSDGQPEEAGPASA